jgi:hypothetical protein
VPPLSSSSGLFDYSNLRPVPPPSSSLLFDYHSLRPNVPTTVAPCSSDTTSVTISGSSTSASTDH